MSDEAAKTSMYHLLERCCAHWNVNLKTLSKKKSWSLGDAVLGRILYRAKSYLDTDEVYKSAIILVELVPYLLEHVGKTTAKKLAKPEEARDVLASAALAVELSQTCARWKAVVRQDIIDDLKGTGFFTDKELESEVEVFTDIQVDEVFDQDYVRVYTLKVGSAPLPTDLKFKMAKETSVSPDLDAYLRASEYMGAKQPGTVVFIPFFKVEARVDLSFWSFFIVYEDHVWVATDQKEFHNPHNKSSTRRPDRVRDNKLDKMWLPDVFLMLEKNRSKSREVEAFGGIKKLMGIKVMDFHPHERFFLIKLAERIVRKCLREDLVEATTMGMHSQRLLLEHKGAIPDKGEALEGWTKDARAHYEELMATVPTTVTKALVPMDYSIVVKSKDFDKNWLGTRQQLDALAHWMVVDQRRSDIQEHFSALKDREEKDSQRMNKVLAANADRIIEFAFAATEIGWLSTAVDQFSSTTPPSGKKFVSDFVEPYKKERYRYGWSIGNNNLQVGVVGDMHDLFSRDAGYKTKCRSCDFSVKQPVKSILVRHWHQFQFLVGGNREAIPPYFRCFKAHNFEPYVGNSILDNTHPLALLKDPCSDSHTNGISIQIFMCGRCANKLSRGKPEKMVYDGEKLVDRETIKASNARPGWVMRWFR